MNFFSQGLALYPAAMNSTPFTLTPDNIDQLLQQLGHLGFNKRQIKEVVEFLSKESPLSSTLLSSLSPLEASIEYLLLHVPECDLPHRFLPSNNSSNPVVISAYSGNTDLKRRWVEEKAVKEAGWPQNTVKECMVDEKLVENWDLLLVALGRKLLGYSFDTVLIRTVETTFYKIDKEEYEAMGAQLIEPGHLILPLFSAPIFIHILFSDEDRYPRPEYIPIYLASPTIPAYVRLHLLSRFLREIKSQPDLEVGEGFCMAVMRIFEGEWALVEDNGPPEISNVLKHIVFPHQKFIPVVDDGKSINVASSKRNVRPRKRPGLLNDADIQEKFGAMQQNDKAKNASLFLCLLSC